MPEDPKGPKTPEQFVTPPKKKKKFPKKTFGAPPVLKGVQDIRKRWQGLKPTFQRDVPVMQPPKPAGPPPVAPRYPEFKMPKPLGPERPGGLITAPYQITQPRIQEHTTMPPAPIQYLPWTGALTGLRSEFEKGEGMPTLIGADLAEQAIQASWQGIATLMGGISEQYKGFVEARPTLDAIVDAFGYYWNDRLNFGMSAIYGISKMPERLLFPQFVLGYQGNPFEWWINLATFGVDSPAINPITNEEGKWVLPTEPLGWEFVPMGWGGSLPTLQASQLAEPVPEWRIERMRDFKERITLPDGKIDWGLLTGKRTPGQTNLHETLVDVTGMTGIGVSFVLRPSKYERFGEMMNEGATMMDIVVELEDPWAEAVFNSVTDPLLWLDIAKPGLGMNIAKVLWPPLIAVDWGIEAVTKRVFRAYYSARTGVTRSVYEAEGEAAPWFTRASARSQHSAYTNTVNDSLDILTLRYDAFTDPDPIEYFQRILLKDDELLNRLGKGSQRVMRDVSDLFDEAGSLDIMEILEKYGVWADTMGPDDLVVRVLEGQTDPSVVAGYLKRAIDDQYMRELGIRGLRRGSLARTFQWLGGAIKENWLGFNAVYMLNNLMDNQIKTIISHYWPTFNLSAPDKIAEYLGRNFKVGLPNAVAQSLIMDVLDTTRTMSTSALPWPIGYPEGMADTLEWIFGRKFDKLRSVADRVKFLKTISYANVLQKGFNLSTGIERMGRAKIFLPAFETDLNRTIIPILAAEAGADNTIGPVLLDWLNSGRLKNPMDDWNAFLDDVLPMFDVPVPDRWIANKAPATTPDIPAVTLLRSELTQLQKQYAGDYTNPLFQRKVRRAFEKARKEVLDIWYDAIREINLLNVTPDEDLAIATGQVEEIGLLPTPEDILPPDVLTDYELAEMQARRVGIQPTLPGPPTDPGDLRAWFINNYGDDEWNDLAQGFIAGKPIIQGIAAPEDLLLPHDYIYRRVDELEGLKPGTTAMFADVPFIPDPLTDLYGPNFVGKPFSELKISPDRPGVGGKVHYTTDYAETILPTTNEQIINEWMGRGKLTLQDIVDSLEQFDADVPTFVDMLFNYYDDLAETPTQLEVYKQLNAWLENDNRINSEITSILRDLATTDPEAMLWAWEHSAPYVNKAVYDPFTGRWGWTNQMHMYGYDVAEADYFTHTVQVTLHDDGSILIEGNKQGVRAARVELTKAGADPTVWQEKLYRDTPDPRRPLRMREDVNDLFAHVPYGLKEFPVNNSLLEQLDYDELLADPGKLSEHFRTETISEIWTERNLLEILLLLDGEFVPIIPPLDNIQSSDLGRSLQQVVESFSETDAYVGSAGFPQELEAYIPLGEWLIQEDIIKKEVRPFSDDFLFGAEPTRWMYEDYGLDIPKELLPPEALETIRIGRFDYPVPKLSTREVVEFNRDQFFKGEHALNAILDRDGRVAIVYDVRTGRYGVGEYHASALGELYDAVPISAEDIAGSGGGLQPGGQQDLIEMVMVNVEYLDTVALQKHIDTMTFGEKNLIIFANNAADVVDEVARDMFHLMVNPETQIVIANWAGGNVESIGTVAAIRDSALDLFYAPSMVRIGDQTFYQSVVYETILEESDLKFLYDPISKLSLIGDFEDPHVAIYQVANNLGIDLDEMYTISKEGGDKFFVNYAGDVRNIDDILSFFNEIGVPDNLKVFDDVTKDWMTLHAWNNRIKEHPLAFLKEALDAGLDLTFAETGMGVAIVYDPVEGKLSSGIYHEVSARKINKTLEEVSQFRVSDDALIVYSISSALASDWGPKADYKAYQALIDAGLPGNLRVIEAGYNGRVLGTLEELATPLYKEGWAWFADSSGLNKKHAPFSEIVKPFIRSESEKRALFKDWMMSSRRGRFSQLPQTASASELSAYIDEHIEQLFQDLFFQFEHNADSTLKGYYSRHTGWVLSTESHSNSGQLKTDVFGADVHFGSDAVGITISNRPDRHVIDIYGMDATDAVKLQVASDLMSVGDGLLADWDVDYYGRTLQEWYDELLEGVESPVVSASMRHLKRKWSIQDLHKGVSPAQHKMFVLRFLHNEGSVRPFVGTWNPANDNLVWSLKADFHNPLLQYQDLQMGEAVTWMFTAKGMLVAGQIGGVEIQVAKEWLEAMVSLRVPPEIPLRINLVDGSTFTGTVGEFLGMPTRGVDMYTETIHDVTVEQAARMQRQADTARANEVLNEILASLDQWEQDSIAELPHIDFTYTSGPEKEAARQKVEGWRTKYINGIEDSTYRAVGEVQRILFDYAHRGNWEEILRSYAPFTTWQLRNPLFWAQAFIQHPTLFNLAFNYHNISEINRKKRNLTSRFGDTIGTELPEMGPFPEGYYAVKPTGLISLFGQFQEPFEPPGTPDDFQKTGIVGALQWAIQATRYVVSPWPWVSYGLEKTGLMPPGSTNLNLGPAQRIIELALHEQGILPPGVTLFGVSETATYLNEYYVERRLAEMMAEGLINEDEFLAAMGNQDDAAWQEAQRFVTEVQTMLGGASLISPFQLKYASPGEMQIRAAKQESAELDPVDKRWYEEANPYLEAYRLIFGDEVDIEIASIYRRYEKAIEERRLQPWYGSYKDLMAQRQVELDSLVGPMAPAEELMQEHLANPIVLGGSDQYGNEYTAESAYSSVLYRLRDVEPRVQDFIIGSTIDWESWNAAQEEFFTNVETLSEDFGWKVSTSDYMKFKYRWATPQKIGYEMYKDWRDIAWDEYESIQPGGPAFLETVLWAAEQQYLADLSAGFTPSEAGKLKAKNISHYTREGIPYVYEQKLLGAYTGRVSLQRFALEVAEIMDVDMASEQRLVLMQQLDHTLPGMFGESDPIDLMRGHIYDYYYNLAPDEKRFVREALGMEQMDLSEATASEVGNIYNAIQLETDRRALFEDGILIFNERNTMPYWPIYDDLTPEELTEIEQARVELYRYHKARDAGVGGTWTPLLDKYYGESDSAQSRFWTALSGVSLDSVVFDDPVMGPVMSRATRTLIGMTEEQYERALDYFLENYDRLVDHEKTQVIKDHPDWYMKAQEERAEYDKYKVLDMEILKSQYYAIYWKDRAAWEEANPAEWEKLNFYLNNERARAMAFPYYSYFFKSYDYGNYWGRRTPDEVPAGEAPQLSEEYIQAQEELDMYVQGEGHWTDLMVQFFGPPPPDETLDQPPPQHLVPLTKDEVGRHVLNKYRFGEMYYSIKYDPLLTDHAKKFLLSNVKYAPEEGATMEIEGEVMTRQGHVGFERDPREHTSYTAYVANMTDINLHRHELAHILDDFYGISSSQPFQALFFNEDPWQEPPPWLRYSDLLDDGYGRVENAYSVTLKYYPPVVWATEFFAFLFTELANLPEDIPPEVAEFFEPYLKINQTRGY